MDKLIFNTHDITLLATVYQSLLFAVMIAVIGRDRKMSDYFLIGFLLTQAAIPMHLLINFGDGFRLIALEFSPNTYRLFEIAYWLEGPLLLWYTRTLIYRQYQFSRTDALFLGPALAYLLYILLTFYSMDAGSKHDFVLYHQTEDESLIHHLTGLVRELLRVLFSVLCLIDIRHYRQQIRQQYSNLEEVDLGWLNTLVGAFLFIRVWAIFVSVAIILRSHVNSEVDFELLGLLGNNAVLIVVGALTIFSLKRSSLYEGLDEQRRAADQQDVVNIDPELIKHIETHMQTAKPYLRNILTIDQLAGQLQVPRKKLSQAINGHFQMNFFEFINRYRIGEAKRQLADPALMEKNVTDVMMDCGFNSKATFNTFFKKLTGKTPSQYRASNAQQPTPDAQA